MLAVEQHLESNQAGVGAHVVYGVVGFKTHAKALLIVRREEAGLMTTNEEITDELSEVFKQLTRPGKTSTLKHLWQAPFTLQLNVVTAI